MKFSTFAAIMLFAGALSAQKYSVTVETHVAGKPEDKFTFVLSEGESQHKGFDGKVLAKRYMARGYPEPSVNMDEYSNEVSGKEKPAAKVAKISPVEEARAKLLGLKNEIMRLENSLAGAQGRIGRLAERAEALEAAIEKGEKTPSLFAGEYKSYLDKYEPDAAQLEKDRKIEAMIRNRPKHRGDVEEFDLGSFCAVKLLKAGGKKVMVNMDYVYSNPVSYFYADGNSNGNTILKQRQFERFERKMRDLVLDVNRPYCIQFERPKIESSKTLSDAMEQTALFSKSGVSRGGGGEAGEGAAHSKYDAEGPYAEIRKQFPTGLARTARIIITVKKVGGGQAD